MFRCLNSKCKSRGLQHFSCFNTLPHSGATSALCIQCEDDRTDKRIRGNHGDKIFNWITIEEYRKAPRYD